MSFWKTAAKVVSPIYAAKEAGFFDSFFGKPQRSDLSEGFRDSQARLDTARGNSTNALTQGRDRALGYVNPYVQSGQRGQTAYENTLGLNGAPARQQQFQEGYLDDPALAYRGQQTQQVMNNLLRKYNAGPQGVNSGAAMMGAGRIAADRFDQDWGDYRNRLMQVGQMGQNMAGQAAGIETGYGKDVAGVETNYGNTSAANRINYANALAASRSIGLNNLLALAGTASRFIPGNGGGGTMPQRGRVDAS